MRILVVYHLRDLQPRATLIDHIYSFRRYSEHEVDYLNVGNGEIPSYVSEMNWDLVIFHYAFVSDRIIPDHFANLVRKVEFLKGSSATKVVIAQDEHIHGDLLSAFINDFGVTHVFTCAGPDDWPKMYRDVDFEMVGFTTVLTGYLDDSLVRKVAALAKRPHSRDIDVGYRSWFPWPSLGRHAQLKGLVGVKVKEAADAAGLKTDISASRGGGNDTKDTLRGDAWYEFLLRCRYTVGVEGGASVLDYDGSVEKCSRAYQANHPDADFDEVESACFAGLDGSIGYAAISPRHLECCATRTGQVLIEGEYNGVLVPGDHYLELKADFSNLGEVVEAMKDESLRIAMTDRAYRDIVESGRWTYQRFVEQVVSDSRATATGASNSRMARVRMRVRDDAFRRGRAFKAVARGGVVALLGEERLRSAMDRLRGR